MKIARLLYKLVRKKQKWEYRVRQEKIFEELNKSIKENSVTIFI